MGLRPQADVRGVRLAALLLAPMAAGAEPLCVPGSIGPRGCDSARVWERPPERPWDRPPLFADGVPAPGAPSARPEPPVAPIPLRRMRPRGDSVLPPVTLEPPGRDPQALRRFQTPYRLD